MITLPELIKRLEESTGPSRELDEAIDRTQREWPVLGGYYGWKRGADGTAWGDIYKPVNGEGTQFESMSAPAYTKSLDAAFKLIPENASSWDCRRIDKDFLASVEFPVDVDGFHNFHAKSSVNAATALTIVALRSRSPQDGER